MKRLFVFMTLFSFSVITTFVMTSGRASAAFNKDLLIDDIVFSNSGSMNSGAIDAFLNARNSCLSPNSGFSAPLPTGYNPNDGFLYGANATAGAVIATSAQVYGLNPQVLLVTLQKEQSLVTSTTCSTNTIAKAMGYGCPDSGGSYSYSGLNLYTRSGTTYTSVNGICVNSAAKAGFSQQTIRAAWLLKFSQERSLGNTGWAVIQGNWDNTDDLSACYSGYMTQGTFKRCPNGSATYYDGWATIDGVATHMNSGATASLYRYTPHFPGNQNFVSIFESWFGPTTGIASVIGMTNVTQPDSSPARGQTISYTMIFSNYHSSAITLDAVGVVGRQGSINSSINRDMGWQGPVTIQPGASQQFTFTSLVRDVGTIYVWPAINYQGTYVHYNNWGAALSAHQPNLSLTTPLNSSLPNPIASQTGTLSATVRNNEDQAIDIDFIGIPVRYYGTYNYDTAWVSLSNPIQPGASQALSGNVTFDKAGPYTAWVSAYIADQYTTVSPLLGITTSQASPNFQLTYTETPHTTPALGEDVAVKFKLKNNSGIGMTLEAVGVVGRYDSPFTGANRDFGWVGPESFTAGEEKTYTAFVSNVSELNNFYAWVAIRYQGAYYHYSNWGFMMSPHLPNLTTTVPVTVNSGNPPPLNQPVNVTATIKSNEPYPVKFSAVGIPIRYYGVYNYDAAWQGAGTLAPSGQAGDTITLNGTVNFDKPGPYTLWASINIQGKYITIGSQQNLNL